MMTLSQAARSLGVDAHTVKRWATLAGMILERDPLDRRSLMLADAEVQELRRIHARDALDVPALLARIEELEARMAALEASRRPYVPVTRREANLSDLAGEVLSTRPEPASVPGEPVAHAQPRPQRAPNPTQRLRGSRKYPPLPAHLTSLTDLARRYGIDYDALYNAARFHKLATIQGKWDSGSAARPLQHALDAENVAKALALFGRADATLAEVVPAGGDDTLS